MKQTPETSGNLREALALAEKGYVPVAMLPRLKVPAEREWQGWMTREVTRDSIFARWERTRNGLAILCKDILVIDVDDANLLDMALEKCGLRLDDVPVCRTPRGGFHLHARYRKGVELRTKIKLRKKEIDLLTGPRLSILPPHTNEDGVPYEWLGEGLPAISDLPRANIAWTRERKRREVKRAIEVVDDGDFMVRRARAYVATIEPAVSGQRGHDRFFRVCCKVLHPPPRGFGLSVPQATPIILEYSDRCQPPWSDREIEHKIQSALEKA